MKKIKKKLRGMTLVEVLVAMAIFTLMASLLAATVATVCRITKKTDNLNKKIMNEGPKAEQQEGGVNEKKMNLKIKINEKNFDVEVDQYKVTEATDSYEDGGDFKYFKRP